MKQPFQSAVGLMVQFSLLQLVFMAYMFYLEPFSYLFVSYVIYFFTSQLNIILGLKLQHDTDISLMLYDCFYLLWCIDEDFNKHVNNNFIYTTFDTKNVNIYTDKRAVFFFTNAPCAAFFN